MIFAYTVIIFVKRTHSVGLRKLAIVRANRYMIDHMDYLIAYAWRPESNARNLVEYAKKRNITVTNLGGRFAASAVLLAK